MMLFYEYHSNFKFLKIYRYIKKGSDIFENFI
jgi:hypothetical protein